MEAIATDHKFTVRCDRSTVRHLHDYKPAPSCPQRCSCGHTKWKVRVGGHATPSVSCAKCGSPNRISTAYETGRAVGFTEASRKEAATL